MKGIVILDLCKFKYLPNEFSVIWLFVSGYIALDGLIPSVNVIYYAMFLYTAFCCYKSYYKRDLKIVPTGICGLLQGFYWLSTVQILGLTQLHNWSSIRSVFCTVLLAIFLHEVFVTVSERQRWWIYVPYVAAIIVCAFKYLILGVNRAEVIIPYTCVFICLLLMEQHIPDKLLIVGFVGLLFIAIKSGSRATLLELSVIFSVYCLLVRFSPRIKFFYLFSLLTIILFVATYLYINIYDYEIYNSINNYSKEMFDKRIDSGRPFLWGASLGNLSLAQAVFGTGTGRICEIEYREGLFFHNAYIQLLIQNGIVGLSVLWMMLYSVGKRLYNNLDSEVGKIVTACFGGMIIFNCFECALIQNRIAIGLLQWMTVTLGLAYISDNECKIDTVQMIHVKPWLAGMRKRTIAILFLVVMLFAGAFYRFGICQDRVAFSPPVMYVSFEPESTLDLYDVRNLVRKPALLSAIFSDNADISDRESLETRFRSDFVKRGDGVAVQVVCNEGSLANSMNKLKKLKSLMTASGMLQVEGPFEPRWYDNESKMAVGLSEVLFGIAVVCVTMRFKFWMRGNRLIW